jgi:hypothetical protein
MQKSSKLPITQIYQSFALQKAIGRGEKGRLTNSVNPPLIRHDLLNTRIRHLLEPAPNTENHARRNHLRDTLARCSDDRADESDEGPSEHEVPPAEDVGEAAADRYDDGGA